MLAFKRCRNHHRLTAVEGIRERWRLELALGTWVAFLTDRREETFQEKETK